VKMSSTVILGAGIIGVSVAYYLAEHQSPSSIHLVEPSPELFASASGYAGGFLARDWFSSAAAPLGALSFDEHRRLAESECGAARWAYARSTSVSFSPGAVPGKMAGKVGIPRRDTSQSAEASSAEREMLPAPSWLWRRDGDAVELISDEGTVAQV
jgi:glycine/D-amino acid oxidase-like deaminating enzyme